MNILHIVLNNVGHGTYWRSLMFGKWLNHFGHSVTMIATAPTARINLCTSTTSEVHIVESPDLFTGSLRSGWDLYNSLRRILWLRDKQFDLVHAFESRPTVILPTLYMHRYRHVPLVMDWADWFGRGGSVEERSNPLTRAILTPIETFFEEFYRGKANASTVICTTLLNKLIQLGIPQENIHLIPNGCDPERFYPTEQYQAREKIGLEPDGIYIGYAGTIYQSDAILMAKAFDLISKIHPKTRLIVAGNCPIDIPTLSKNPHAIIQTGRLDQENFRLHLAACDLFWLPMRDTQTNRGRWPLKLSDYLAMGRPIVSTAVGDVQSFIAHEPVGVTSSDTAEDFADQTIMLMKDPISRDRMGRHARKLAENNYHWKQQTRKLIRIYEQLLNNCS